MIELIEEHVNRYQLWTLWQGINDELAEYKELLKALREAQKGDIIDIDIESPGGNCAVGFKIIQHIQDCEAQVNIIVSGACYSMGSLIAISGDTIQMKDNTYLMFHTYSACIGGMKSGDLVAYVDNAHVQHLNYDEKIAKPFLTDKEVEQMQMGKELYIWHNDKSLPNRIKRHFKQ